MLILKPGYGNKAAPRKYWPKGKIVNCNKSKDGVVRSVEVKLASGKMEKHVV